MQCFASLLLIASAILADPDTNESLPDKRLVRFSDSEALWLTPDEITNLTHHKIGHVDDTDGSWSALGDYAVQRKAAKVYPSRPAYSNVVQSITATVRPSDLESILSTFVNQFSNRIYTTSQGKQSCGWVFNQVDALSDISRSDVEFSTRKFKHKFGQYSVIARVTPIGAEAAKDIVIVSAHQDSINWEDKGADKYIAPGADDDGSGTVAALYVLRRLLESSAWKPKRPVEFHWYAAEEVDLQGSVAVVKEYASKRTDVYAQMQLDMVGWPGYRRVINLMDDDTSRPLNVFLEALVKKYLDVPVVHDRCGYACSDHASWHKAGYPASFPYESQEDNPNIHSTEDTLDTIDFQHVARFAKLAVAYVVELTQGA